jgi:NADPH:quinone reductase-like Zn-dependent oxidoreductase
VLAVTATAFDPDNPLSGLAIGDVGEPSVPNGWRLVSVRAATLNHHDLWSLKGVGLRAEQLPMVLGCDASGITEDGREVVVHAVIGHPDAGGGDETLDPDRTLLSERHPGTLAERVAVPVRNLVDKPASLTHEQAACLPTAWLTAWRMLVTRGQVRPGHRVLVQGAGGGVATAAIQLASAMGARVYVTSRDEERLSQARELGAYAGLLSGGRLPERVDVVIETVGAATWDHSLKSLEPGGVLVVSGSTSGPNPPADLQRVFFRQLSVVGSTMGTRSELVALLRFLDSTGLRPVVDSVRPLADARAAFERLASGSAFGKLVLTA